MFICYAYVFFSLFFFFSLVSFGVFFLFPSVVLTSFFLSFFLCSLVSSLREEEEQEGNVRDSCPLLFVFSYCVVFSLPLVYNFLVHIFMTALGPFI